MPPKSQSECPKPRQGAGGTSVDGVLPLGCPHDSPGAYPGLSFPICNMGKRNAASLMRCWVHRFLMIGLTLKFKCQAEGQGLKCVGSGNPRRCPEQGSGLAGLWFSQLLLKSTQQNRAQPGFKPRPRSSTGDSASR